MSNAHLLQFLPFSRKPLAKGLAAIFSCVIWGTHMRGQSSHGLGGAHHPLQQGHLPAGSDRLSQR